MNTNMTAKEMAAEIERLTRENAALAEAATKANTLSIKLSEKGGVSVYGLGRFPVTLYAEQWARLNDIMPKIGQFIEANKSHLSTKADRDARRAATAAAAAVTPAAAPAKAVPTMAFGALNLK